MPFVVLYDANALYGNAQRDLLVRIARAGHAVETLSASRRDGQARQ
jgi:hypothetical protein